MSRRNGRRRGRRLTRSIGFGFTLLGMRCHFLIGALILGACVSAHAQWLNQPMAGAPRTPDGKVNMTGPVPRVNGKPDLSGLWQVEAEPRSPGLF